VQCLTDSDCVSGSACRGRKCQPAPPRPKPVPNNLKFDISILQVQATVRRNAAGLLEALYTGPGGDTQIVPLTLSASGGAVGCPVLNLQVGEIHLNLLGLNVDTSQVCLDITAQQGQLLGDLLCQLSTALAGGTPLLTFLNGLTAQNLASLLSGLTNILNNGPLFANVLGVSGTSAGACDILNLALGPLDLNVFGLVVHGDNCNNGPITIDITATDGLLGNLLCNLNGLLSPGGKGGASALLSALNQIIARINVLL